MRGTKHVADRASIDNSEIVFVGYGVVAPEFGWDDYKDVDVKGKTLVMLVNDPPVPDPANADALDPKTFGGKAMTYYGRWTYKYEIGKEKGAAGVLLIHETGPAGYPFDVVQSKVTEQFDLITPDKNLGRVSIEGWISLEQGKRLLQMGGQDYEALKKLAATRDFKPVPLGVTASMTLHNTLRTIDSRNVVAKLEGSDPVLKRSSTSSTPAHWGSPGHRDAGQRRLHRTCYNGAQDNASWLRRPARDRQGVYQASGAAEAIDPVSLGDGGGAGACSDRSLTSVMPIYPLAKTLADINMDGLPERAGRTKDLILVGFGASDLDDYVRAVAAEQGRQVKADAEPEKGFYYRSDHFNFAKQGVPALDPDDGIDYVGRPDDFGQKVRDDYTQHRYHSPSDVVMPDWDLSGAREDLKVFFAVGYRIAQAAGYPEWKPGNEFQAKRRSDVEDPLTKPRLQFTGIKADMDPMTGDEMVALSKRHTLFEWSAQSKVDPIPVARAKAASISGRRTAMRFTDFNSQLMCVNIASTGDELRGSAPSKTRRRRLRALRQPVHGDRAAGPARSKARRDLSRRHRRILLHQRGRRGKRECHQAGALGHGAAQDSRALSLLPVRCNSRQHHADRRPGGRWAAV